MTDPIDPKTIDKRTWERYVRSGQLDPKNYDKFLKTLPDVAEKAASVKTVMYEDEALDRAIQSEPPPTLPEPENTSEPV